MKPMLFFAVASGVGGARAARADVSIEIPPDFAGFSSQALPTTIGNLVGILVSFLGLLLLLIILAGGLIWMTSGGNEDRIAQAKRMIIASIIGLVIILMAYSIAAFITSSLSQAL